MKVIRLFVGVGIFCSFIYAKNFSSFSLAPTFPLTNSKALTIAGREGDSIITTEKSLNSGWGIGWTFFGRPSKNESLDEVLPFGVGGKISFNHWKRDSTLTYINYLNLELIGRWYFLEKSKLKFPHALFIQGGTGAVIGEYPSFSEPDTIDWRYKPTDNPIIIQGKWGFSNMIGVGIVWDIIEFLPSVNFTIIRGKLAAWLSFNLAVTF